MTGARGWAIVGAAVVALAAASVAMRLTRRPGAPIAGEAIRANAYITLAQLVTAQEAWHATHGRYAARVEELATLDSATRFTPSRTARAMVLRADSLGWSGESWASADSARSRTCVVWAGEVAARPATRPNGWAAEVEGRPVCEREE